MVEPPRSWYEGEWNSQEKTQLGLLKISGKDVEKYNQALTNIGCKPISLESFEIDKAGYSPQIAEKLGTSYMQNHIIIVNPEQRNKAVLNKDCSFLEKLTEEVYNQTSKIIKTFTQEEALYGKILTTPQNIDNPQLTTLLNESNPTSVEAAESNTSANFAISTQIDTPNQTLNKIRKAIKDVNELETDNNLMLDKTYLNNILQRVKELNQSYGQIEDFEQYLTPTTIGVDSFKLKTSNHEFYAINGEKELIVYFGEKQGLKDEQLIHASRKHDILTKLIEYSCAKINEELTENEIKTIERKVLEENIQGFEQLDLMERYRRLENLRKSIPPKFSELWKVIKDKTNFNQLNLKLKFEIISLTTENKILKELMEKVKG